MVHILHNHSYVNEIQTITQIFFPHEKFQYHSIESLSVQSPVFSGQGYGAVSCTNGAACTGEIWRDGVCLFTCHRMAPDGSSIRRTLMLVLFDAFKQVFAVNTPWGALTGIRPSKLVRTWLEEGHSPEQAVALMTDLYRCSKPKALLAMEVAQAEIRLAAKLQSPFYLKNPLGLYVGIPFCPSRCLYCSFITSPNVVSVSTQTRYVHALIKECEGAAQALREGGYSLSSLYVGGGTPTALTEELLALLLDKLNDYFSPFVQANAEYTVEAGRPDSFTPEKLRLLQVHGVNRIAVNPQTLRDHTLRRIGRRHTADDFYRAFEMARSIGFNHINTDVILGLPGETAEDVALTMTQLTQLAPESITVHTLAVKRASRLNEQLRANDSDSLTEAACMEEMLRISQAACRNSGLQPYYLYRQKNMIGHFENVGYAMPGFESLYNVGMMAELQTILAVGAGAVSKFVNGSRIDRIFNVKNPDVYIARVEGTEASGGSRYNDFDKEDEQNAYASPQRYSRYLRR